MTALHSSLVRSETARTTQDVTAPATDDTPEGLTWRFGIGCMDVFHYPARATPLTEKDVARAMHHAEEGTIPTKGEVRQWIPGPFAWLAAHGQPCTYERMDQYWHIDHLTALRTPTWIGEILSVPLEEKFYTITPVWCIAGYVPGQMVIDMWGWRPEPHTLVYVHAGIITDMARVVHTVAARHFLANHAHMPSDTGM
jgi:hypothetical protein